MTFSYERINGREHSHYRIADENDNRIATCYRESNAILIVTKLNALATANKHIRELEAAAEKAQRLWSMDIAHLIAERKASSTLMAALERALIEAVADDQDAWFANAKSALSEARALQAPKDTP